MNKIFNKPQAIICKNSRPVVDFFSKMLAINQLTVIVCDNQIKFNKSNKIVLPHEF